MKIDLSLPLTQPMLKKLANLTKSRAHINFFGHMGTHLDLMGKTFDLNMTETMGQVFDVRAITDREILPEDIDLSSSQPGDFVMFYTGSLDRYGYGNNEYFLLSEPQLSYPLTDLLIEKKIAYIGVDMGGARKMAEHPIFDQYCADRNVFIVENLANLKQLYEQTQNQRFQAHIYPLSLADATGLPCRVIAQI